MHRIARAEAHPDHTMTLHWTDGRRSTADFRPLIKKGRIYKPLRAARFFAEGWQIRDEGRVLAWSGMLEFCADALRYEGFPEERARDLPPVAAE